MALAEAAVAQNRRPCWPLSPQPCTAVGLPRGLVSGPRGPGKGGGVCFQWVETGQHRVAATCPSQWDTVPLAGLGRPGEATGGELCEGPGGSGGQGPVQNEHTGFLFNSDQEPQEDNSRTSE